MRPRHFCVREDDRRLCGERSEAVLTEHEVCGLRVHHAKDRREEVVVGRNMVMKQHAQSVLEVVGAEEECVQFFVFGRVA